MIVFEQVDDGWMFKKYDKLLCKKHVAYTARSGDSWASMLVKDMSLKAFLLKDAIMNPADGEELFKFSRSWLQKVGIVEEMPLDAWPVNVESDMLEAFDVRGKDAQR